MENSKLALLLLSSAVAACSSSEYADRTRLARDFLDGEDDTPVEVLRAEMEFASNKLEYERAASYRDKLKRLEALRKEFGRLRFADESLSFSYTVPGFDGSDRTASTSSVGAVCVANLTSRRPTPITRR